MALKNSLAVCLIFSFALCSCGIYTFTGTSIDYSKTKTITINQFNNNSASGPPEIANTFTEKAKDYYQQNTDLEITGNNGDLILDAQIIGYDVRPQAAQANETAALNRLTIRLEATFENTTDDTQNFTQTFSFFKDFPQTQNLSDVEDEYIDEISDQIIIDIFNKSVANW